MLGETRVDVQLCLPDLTGSTKGFEQVLFTLAQEQIVCRKNKHPVGGCQANTDPDICLFLVF